MWKLELEPVKVDIKILKENDKKQDEDILKLIEDMKALSKRIDDIDKLNINILERLDTIENGATQTGDSLTIINQTLTTYDTRITTNTNAISNQGTSIGDQGNDLQQVIDVNTTQSDDITTLNQNLQQLIQRVNVYHP